jgi:class 3 adenylate cyclase/CheY-like chemotaxis protein
VRNPARILVADDNEANVDILVTRLAAQGYETVAARDGEEALATAREALPDLILLDIMMPKMDGIEVCRRLKSDRSLPFMPIILVTAKADTRDVVAGLDAGADEYLTKPVDQASLVARVRSILRAKALHDTVEEQRQRIAIQAEELVAWNKSLEARVAAQLGEIERIGRLRRFLPRQVADMIVAGGEDGERALASHRREVTVVFCDLRGFTGFAETAEPEEVMGVLNQYHGALGPAIQRHEGTLERFMGDGLVVLFNDPMPCPDPSLRAVKMAVDMRAAVAALESGWRRRGHELGFGVGIAEGYATLGRVGFEGRYDYMAVGTVANLGARLCAAAKPGEILVSGRVAEAVRGHAPLRELGALSVKGLAKPVATFAID